MVKSSILNLVDRHVVSMPSIPFLASLLLSLLPGLEDETGEHFNRVFDLLSRLKERDPVEFYQTLWFLMATTGKHRVSMVNFITRDLASGSTLPDPKSPSIAKACIAALQDKQTLVARGILDLITMQFPLAKAAELFDEALLVALVKEAMLILLRRDMSLTRRYYMWVAPDDVMSDQSIALQSMAFELLLAEMNPKSLDSCLKPFKVTVFIMDKPAIANPILKRTFSAIIRSLQTLLATLGSCEESEKLLNAANLLFDSVELDMAWGQLCQMTNGLCDASVIDTLRFCIKKLTLCDDESKRIHMPLFLFAIANGLEGTPLASRIDIFIDVLQIVLSGPALSGFSEDDVTEDLVVTAVQKLAQDGSLGEEGLDMSPVGACLLALGRMNRTIQNEASPDAALMTKALAMNEILLGHTGPLKKSSVARAWTTFLKECCLKGSCEMESLVHSLLRLNGLSPSFLEPDDFVSALIPKIWQAGLSINSLFAIVNGLHALDGETVENHLSISLSSGGIADRLRSLRVFSEIWTFSARRLKTDGVPFPRPLFHLIDMLADQTSALQQRARLWLASSIDTIPRVLEMLVEMMIEALPSIEDGRSWTPEYTKCFNVAQLKYAVDCVNLLVGFGAGPLMDLLDEAPAPRLLELRARQALPQRFEPDGESELSYTSLLLLVLVPFMSTRTSSQFTTSIIAQVENLQTATLKTLLLIASTTSIQSNELTSLCDATTGVLAAYIESRQIHRTPDYLSLLELLLGKKSDLMLNDLVPLCCAALEQVDDPATLRSWIGFIVEAIKCGSASWTEFVGPQLQTLTRRLYKARLQASDILLYQTIIEAVEEFLMHGIGLTAVEKPPSPTQTKTRHFIRNVMNRNTSASPLQSSEVPVLTAHCFTSHLV